MFELSQFEYFVATSMTDYRRTSDEGTLFLLTAGVNYKELAAVFNKQTVNAFTNCTHDDAGRYSYNEDYNLKEVIGMVGVSNF